MELPSSGNSAATPNANPWDLSLTSSAPTPGNGQEQDQSQGPGGRQEPSAFPSSTSLAHSTVPEGVLRSRSVFSRKESPVSSRVPGTPSARRGKPRDFTRRAESHATRAVKELGHEHSGWLYTLFLAYSTIGTIYGDLGTSPLYTVSAISGQLDRVETMDLLGMASCIFWTLTLIPLFKYVFIVLFADDLGEGGTFALYSNLCRCARISLMGSRVNKEIQQQLAEDYTGSTALHRSLSRSSKRDEEAGPTPAFSTLQSITEGANSEAGQGAGEWRKEKPRPSPSGRGGGGGGGGGGAAALLPRGSGRAVGRVLERHWSLRQLMLFLTLLGTCGVLADGVLTPSISVLSAVEGLEQENVNLDRNAIVAISCGILMALFLVQPFGTNRISVAFSPIILTWLLSIATIGVYNIATYMPSVFKAISPWYAYQFFARNGFNSWVALGDIVLSITGGEAMFADMGHFNRASIQISFTLLVYPCVILNYFGQVAFLSTFPEVASTAFFSSVPVPVRWPVFIVATLAAITASQALITGAFSIIKQSMTLSCFPKSRIVHTSEEHEGQIYIPVVNWTLMVMCVAVTAGFRDSAAIGNAYGVAVVMVMVLTTTLVSTVMLVSWDLHWAVVLPFWLFYTAFEGLFFSSTLYKVPEGGWFPLVLSAILLFVMYTWHFGTYKKRHYAEAHLQDTTLRELLGVEGAQGVPVVRFKGAAIVYSEMDNGVPPVLLHYLANVPAIQEVVLCVTVKQLPVPRLTEEYRLLVEQITSVPGFYRAIVFYGYQEFPFHGSTDFVCRLRDELLKGHGAAVAPSAEVPGSLSQRVDSAWAGCNRDSFRSAPTSPGHTLTPAPSEHSPANGEGAGLDVRTYSSADSAAGIGEEQLVLDAWGYSLVYFMGRTSTVSAGKANLATKFLIPVYSLFKALSSTQANAYGVPNDRLLEVGMVYELE